MVKWRWKWEYYSLLLFLIESESENIIPPDRRPAGRAWAEHPEGEEDGGDVGQAEGDHQGSILSGFDHLILNDLKMAEKEAQGDIEGRELNRVESDFRSVKVQEIIKTQF